MILAEKSGLGFGDVDSLGGSSQAIEGKDGDICMTCANKKPAREKRQVFWGCWLFLKLLSHLLDDVFGIILAAEAEGQASG